MATLTYDASEPQDSEFTSEEQESLEIGEKLVAEQQNLLAGKFKSAEDLENAYVELQSKLGQPKEQPPAEEPQAEQAEEPEEIQEEQPDDDGFLDRLWDEATSDEDGYSDEFLEELSKYDSADIAQMFLDYKEQVDAPNQLSEDDVKTLINIPGGQEEYTQMIGWASQNLTEGEIAMFDQVMEKGDPLSCFFAVQALAYRYGESDGIDPALITGGPAASSKQTFRSQAELVRAMADPRYDNDPAYRQDIMQALKTPTLISDCHERSF